MHAMSLNYRDILVADHSPDYPLLAKPNLIPGSDGAGIVESAGSASHWNRGDRIVLFPHTWLSGSPRNYVFDQTLGGAERDGTFQKYMLVDERFVVKAPEGMSLVEASTLFTAGVTAWNALCYGNEEGNGVRFLEGKTVLTQGTGGVSCYAIQVSYRCSRPLNDTDFSVRLMVCFDYSHFPLDRIRRRRNRHRNLLLGRQTRNRPPARRDAHDQLPQDAGLVLGSAEADQRRRSRHRGRRGWRSGPFALGDQSEVRRSYSSVGTAGQGRQAGVVDAAVALWGEDE
jgi:hypothetical protein